MGCWRGQYEEAFRLVRGQSPGSAEALPPQDQQSKAFRLQGQTTQKDTKSRGGGPWESGGAQALTLGGGTSVSNLTSQPQSSPL